MTEEEGKETKVGYMRKKIPLWSLISATFIDDKLIWCIADLSDSAQNFKIRVCSLEKGAKYSETLV
jgi:hypothetical protein